MLDTVQEKEFKRYLAIVGGVPEASYRLGCSRQLLYHICNKVRKINPDLAIGIERDTRGKIHKEKLIWGRFSKRQKK